MQWLLKRFQARVKVKYGVWQVERCPTTRRLHVHLYVVMSNPCRFATFNDPSFGFPGFSVLVRRGSDQQAWDYCSKERTRASSTFYSVGHRTAQGQRSDIDRARDSIVAGHGVRAVVTGGAKYQALRYAETICKYMEPVRDWMPECYWFYGSTGSGKTRSALDIGLSKVNGDRSKIWMSCDTLQWWQGYDAHPVVIIDDFRKDYCKFHTLLRILDRYEFQVPVKGGSRQLLARWIFITCPWDPDVMYANQADKLEQLLRRLGCSPPENDRSRIRLFGNVVPMPNAGASAPGFVSSRVQ